ncbi:MAG: proline reductase cluster protein PrdD [Tissierellia bacterium]|nr:proline reductase cluster protein PrdD [Tissierellia bacterium]
MNEIDQRRLVIKAFHANRVKLGEKCEFKDGVLEIPGHIESNSDLVKSCSLSIIEPGKHDIQINTIMDIIPISTKVLGRLGEGVTHTFTGVYVMLTGVDEDGRQMHEFGSSEGNLMEQLVLDRAGTPGSKDYIIHIDVLMKGGQPFERLLANEAFAIADNYISSLRKILKKADGTKADESHEYYDKIRKGATKVALIKQIAGQGAMYDNMLFTSEPSGFDGISIIDMANMPILLSPNEYRDGAIRALV